MSLPTPHRLRAVEQTVSVLRADLPPVVSELRKAVDTFRHSLETAQVARLPGESPARLTDESPARLTDESPARLSGESSSRLHFTYYGSPSDP